MLCNIKPVPFHESDKHIFAKIPGGGGGGSGPPVPPSGSAHDYSPLFMFSQFIITLGNNKVYDNLG